jgi:Tfp pilus assembly protein PilZ
MDQPKSEPPKQRAHARYNLRLPVRVVYQERTGAGESRNLSIGGMFIETPEPIPYGAQLQIVFSIPTHNQEIKTNAVVCWVERDSATPAGIGVKFGALRAIEVWALNQLFAQF